jgi:uncharacterized membrane protein YccC
MTQPASLPQPLKEWFVRHAPQLRLSVRVAVAGVVAYMIGSALNFPQVYWVTFSAVLVTQASVGGSVKAAIDRFIGTAGGAAYGGALGTLLPQAEVQHALLLLIATLIPTALLAAIRPTFRLAPITALIVLFGMANTELTVLQSAIDRVLEIAAGSLIGICVSLVVLPTRAHDLVGEAARDVLVLLVDIIAIINAIFQQRKPPVDLDEVRARLVTALALVETTAEEARRERRAYLSSEPDPSPVARTLQRLRNDIAIFGRAAQETFPDLIRTRLAPHFSGVAEKLSDFLLKTGTALARRTVPPDLDDVIKTLDLYSAEMAALREAEAIRQQPTEIAGRVFALSFGLEQIRADLIDLRNRAVERARD